MYREYRYNLYKLYKLLGLYSSPLSKTIVYDLFVPSHVRELCQPNSGFRSLNGSKSRHYRCFKPRKHNKNNQLVISGEKVVAKVVAQHRKTGGGSVGRGTPDHPISQTYGPIVDPTDTPILKGIFI